MKTTKPIRILSEDEIKLRTTPIPSNTVGSGDDSGNIWKYTVDCPDGQNSVSCSGVQAKIEYASGTDGTKLVHYIKCFDVDGNITESPKCNLSSIGSGDSGDSGAKDRYEACKNKQPGSICEWTDANGMPYHGFCESVSDTNFKKACRSKEDLDWPPKD